MVSDWDVCHAKSIDTKKRKKKGKIYEVEVVSNKNAGGCRAKKIGSKEKPLKLWFGNEFIKAVYQERKLKRLTGTKWKAAKRSAVDNCIYYLAIEQILTP